MMQRWKKIVSIVLILGVVGGSFIVEQPQAAHAGFLGIDWCGQFFVCLNPTGDPAAISSAVSNGATAVSSTITSGMTTAKFIADGTPVERAVTDAVLTPGYCDAYGDTTTLQDVAYRASKSIAGADYTDIDSVLFPTYQVDSLQAQLTGCWIPLSIAANNAKGATNSQSQNIETNRSIIAQKKSDLQNQIAQHEKEQDDAYSGVFQGIMYNFTQAIAQDAALKGVKNLNHELGNNDPMLLFHALSTQVYGVREINDNSGTGPAQAIAGAIFRSKALKDATGLDTAQKLAQVEAAKFHIDPASLQWTSPDYWTKVSNAGDPNGWSEVHIFAGNATADQAISTGNILANNEIQQNQYKNVRSCTDPTLQQTQTNTSLAAATDKVTQAEIAIDYYKQHMDPATQATSSDMQVLQQKKTDAVKELTALQAKTGSGVVSRCDNDIKTLSQVAQQSTQSWMAQIFDQTKYNQAHPTLGGQIAGKLGKTLADKLFNIPNGSTFGGVLGGYAGQFGTTAINNVLGNNATPATTPPIFPTTTHSSSSSAPSGAPGTLGAIHGDSVILPRGPDVPFMPRGPEPTN